MSIVLLNDSNVVCPYMIIALTFNTVVMQDFYLSYMYVEIAKARKPIVCYRMEKM